MDYLHTFQKSYNYKYSNQLLCDANTAHWQHVNILPSHPNHSVLRIPAATPRTNAFWGKTSWTHRYFRALHCKRWWHVSMYQLCLNHLGRIIAVHRPQECLKLDSLHSKYKPVFKSFWGVTWSNIPKNWSNYYHRNQWREPHPQPMTLAADPIKLWMHDQ